VALPAVRADACYFFAYVGLIILWPILPRPSAWLWVIVPLALAYAVVRGTRCASRVPASTASFFWRSGAESRDFCLMLIPGFELAIERRFDPVAEKIPAIAHSARVVWRRRGQRRSGARVSTSLSSTACVRRRGRPGGQCVFSIKPSLVSFYTGRRGVALRGKRCRAGVRRAPTNWLRYFRAHGFYQPVLF